MSYNIDSWKTRKIENLVIPVSALMTEGIRITIEAVNHVTVRGDAEGFSIKGILKPDSLIEVNYVSNYGEFSGNFMEVVEEILRKSTGTLEAVLIWEGGDSVEKLTVVDGNITRKEIDL